MKCTKIAAATAGLVLALGAASPAMADAESEAVVANSPGVLSGNNIAVPIHIPINICGNTIDIIALLNPSLGNVCINQDGEEEEKKGHHGQKKGHHGPEKGHHGPAYQR
ncbi:chaplin [Streptomyces sp. NPDC001780]